MTIMEEITKYGKYVALAIIVAVIGVALVVWGRQKGDTKMTYAGYAVIGTAGIIGVGGYLWEKNATETPPSGDRVVAAPSITPFVMGDGVASE